MRDLIKENIFHILALLFFLRTKWWLHEPVQGLLILGKQIVTGCNAK